MLLLEDQVEANSAHLALQSLHRTLDRSRFDPEDVTSDLEIVVSQAKMNNNPKAREYECVLDQIQKHSKSLSRIGLKDLFVTLIGDPAKSVLEKCSREVK